MALKGRNMPKFLCNIHCMFIEYTDMHGQQNIKKNGEGNWRLSRLRERAWNTTTWIEVSCLLIFFNQRWQCCQLPAIHFSHTAFSIDVCHGQHRSLRDSLDFPLIMKKVPMVSAVTSFITRNGTRLWTNKKLATRREGFSGVQTSVCCKSYTRKYSCLYWSVISCFRREAKENRAVLGHYAASCGNFLPRFRDNLSVPSSGVKFFNPENWTYRLSRNVSNKLPLLAALYLRIAQFLFCL